MKTWKKLTALALSLVLGIGVLAACTASTPTTTAAAAATTAAANSTEAGETAAQGETTAAAAPTELKKIVIGTQPSTMGVPVQYAYENGFFTDLGLDVELVLFPTGAPLNEALAAGQLDVAANGLASVFPLANGVCQWIGEGNTTGGMGIFVRDDSPILQEKGLIEGKPEMYGSDETIKGTTFLGPLGTSAQFNVMRYIQQYGLTDSDISQIHMDHGQAFQAFVAGEGDALATSPPFSYDAAAQGFTMIASFEDATESPLFDGLLARTEYAKDHHDEILAFVKGYYQACEVFMADPELRKTYSMKWFADNGREYTEETMLQEIKDRDYVTKSMMESPDYSYGKGMLAIADFYTSDGKVLEEDLPNVPASFDTSYIEEALGITINHATYDDIK